MSLTSIVNSDQMRAIEDRAEAMGVSKDALMENAGLAVAQRVFGLVRHVPNPFVFVLVGPGNNGGDGLVTARHLQAWSVHTEAYLVRERQHPDPKLDIARDAGVTVTAGWEDATLESLRRSLQHADVVVDAVLGTGRARAIESPLSEMLAAVSEARRASRSMKVVAVDLPTGLDADTGALDPSALPADLTITLGLPKCGLFLLPGSDFVGEMEIQPIGLPPGIDTVTDICLMTSHWAALLLPRRPSSGHKGTFGRAMIVAGSRNYLGAAYLAASAATRAGAGLVTIAIPESLQMAVAAKSIEPTFLPLPESSPGVVSPDAASLVLDALDGYDALLLGCGLGQHADTIAFAERILYSSESLPPTLVDADGLNTLARTDDWHERFSSNAVLTPHPGEMARLTRTSAGAVQGDRFAITRRSASAWNKVTVLKGAHTVVAGPDDAPCLVSPFANPGLASAGTGDILSGVIAGLLSQGLSLFDAASLGVYLHGLAGGMVRDELGDTGMLASDLLPVLPRAIKALREGKV